MLCNIYTFDSQPILSSLMQVIHELKVAVELILNNKFILKEEENSNYLKVACINKLKHFYGKKTCVHTFNLYFSKSLNLQHNVRKHI